MYRMFIADTDSENIKKLSGFLVHKHDIVPDVWLNRRRYLKFLEESENAIVFIRMDDYAVPGLELTQNAISHGTGIHVVWMASNGAYAVDAFRYGAEAYLLLPAIEETLYETINSMNNGMKGN